MWSISGILVVTMRYLQSTITLLIVILLFVVAVESVSADRGESVGEINSREQPRAELVVDQPTEIPNTLLWKKVGQKISLFFTFDPVKDAQKRVEFAEENMLLAEFIVQNRSRDSHDKMVTDLVNSANSYISSIQRDISGFVERADEDQGVRMVLQNMATHIQNKQKALGTIREYADEAKLNELVDSIVQANKIQEEVTVVIKDAAAAFNFSTILNKTFSIHPAVLQLLKNDQDGDGLSDSKEDELGTSKLDFDTDGDGLSDKEEVDSTKTDPLKADTDGDGYWDAFEIMQGYSPVGTGKLELVPRKPLINAETYAIIKNNVIQGGKVIDLPDLNPSNP